jgi:lipid A 4'-phosphatase
VLSLLLAAFPGVDLAVSRLFHVEGAGFPASQVGFLIDLRELGMAAFKLLMAAAVASLAVPFLLPGVMLPLRPRAGLFLAASALLGPGLLVNAVLKDHVGRARPRDVLEFGGDLPFTLPWEISDACARNCSFVSGEASSSIFLLALAMIAPPAWKRPVALSAIAFAAVMSANRIAFGGHFLSDVVIAWTLTLAVLLLVHRAIYRPGSPVTDAALAGWLGAAGLRTGRALRAVGGRFRRLAARFR